MELTNLHVYQTYLVWVGFSCEWACYFGLFSKSEQAYLKHSMLLDRISN